MLNTRSYVTLTLLAGGLVSPLVLANEDKYPASNFEPSVIFANAELIEKTHGVLAGGSQVQAVATVTVHETDPKYPAAYFNPTVLYPTR